MSFWKQPLICKLSLRLFLLYQDCTVLVKNCVFCLHGWFFPVFLCIFLPCRLMIWLDLVFHSRFEVFSIFSIIFSSLHTYIPSKNTKLKNTLIIARSVYYWKQCQNLWNASKVGSKEHFLLLISLLALRRSLRKKQ